jgi:hypothetical protein
VLYAITNILLLADVGVIVAEKPVLTADPLEVENGVCVLV